MKSILTSSIVAGSAVLPAYAHNDPVPHTHDLPFWALALMGLAAGALGTWGNDEMFGSRQRKPRWIILNQDLLTWTRSSRLTLAGNV